MLKYVSPPQWPINTLLYLYAATPFCFSKLAACNLHLLYLTHFGIRNSTSYHPTLKNQNYPFKMCVLVFLSELHVQLEVGGAAGCVGTP